MICKMCGLISNKMIRPRAYLIAFMNIGPLCLLSNLFEIYPLTSRFLSLPGNIDPFQLLQFIVLADGINLLHMAIKMTNMFVVQNHSLELVRLAVGDFGSSLRGEERVRNSAS